MAGSTRRRLSLRQLIWACLGVMSVVFVSAIAASFGTRIAVGHAVSELGDRLIPLRGMATELSRSYTNQDIGQRGFMLTDNPVSLESYHSGVATAERLIRDLRRELAHAPHAEDLLANVDDIEATANIWRTQAAEPQIAAQRAGPVPRDQVSRMALEGKPLFDDLREQYRALSGRIDSLIQDQLQHIRSIQRTANIIQYGAAIIMAAVIISAVIAVQRLLTRPVARLVRDVRTVADGVYDQSISRAGPREIAEVSAAVEDMRDSLRAATGRLVDAELRDEQARIAADLHDRVIQRVFGLGLGLTSAAARGNRELGPFIDETDSIIRDLRESIFNLDHAISAPARATRLRSAIIDMLDGDITPLDFTPTLKLDGPVEAVTIPSAIQASVLAVIRESLSNIARHAQATAATVSVVIGDNDLRIMVTDNGIGISRDDVMGNGRRNIQARAQQFGGYADITNANPGPGTIVAWIVPLPSNP